MPRARPFSRPSRHGPRSTSIHVLNNDVLLNIFCLYRPDLLDEDDIDGDRILQGGEWVRERWWYTFTQVCQRWRYLMLQSASYLGLCLVCTRGTPVADMLAHSPPLPLIIDHINQDPVTTTEDEEGILLALQHHNRIRRIRFQMPVQICRSSSWPWRRDIRCWNTYISQL
ncbi:hypothetical protein BC826DRAFT_523176 [Russula brevipes]|nr:hypothetical protein BC826DRAFT_523176 [Russula brevipes]